MLFRAIKHVFAARAEGKKDPLRKDISDSAACDAVAASRIGVWDWHIESGVMEFSRWWVENLGYEREELQPFSMATFEAIAHPEDFMISKMLIDEHVQGKSEVYLCEVRLRHKSGRWVWMLDRSVETVLAIVTPTLFYRGVSVVACTIAISFIIHNLV